jgi:hypothetical protein
MIMPPSGFGLIGGFIERGIAGGEFSAGWLVEPDVGRVAHGVPARVHRLRALGNAVVPQIPELLGRPVLLHLERPPA